MIVGQIHQGSGVGNQLHRYVMTRVKALELNTTYGFKGVENWKGDFFTNIDFGEPPVETDDTFLEERINNEQGVDIRPYDKFSEKMIDDTLIDGEFQDERYWENHYPEVKKWLEVEPLDIPDDVCVINFRGGEYVGVKDLFLPQSYWDEAIKIMRGIRMYMRFEVHTDDPETAKKFFPNFPITHDVGINWRAIRHAKHLILSNSSFAILPSLLGDAEHIIAPKYWAGYNKGYWGLPQNEYKRFDYI